ncbi:hypothetical protein ACFOMD_02180 [Sphingoaurantiacus capsulatus]|uniref:Protein TonB n=1 Tax=Sphingoaurantiacus capsulatus TaxID=1771310 RepID=A0ABV7X5D0_9SPHN
MRERTGEGVPAFGRVQAYTTTPHCAPPRPKLGSAAMRLALPFRSPDRPPLQLRRRTLVLILVVALHLLLTFLALRMGAPDGMPEFGGGAIQLLPEIRDSEEDEDSEEEVEPEVEETVAVDETPPPPVVVAEEQYDLSIIPLTREEFAASDIARMPQQPKTDNGGAQAGDSVPVGAGPNGEPIYNAEWQREPTSAELAYYIPANIPRPSWGLIACQTAPRFRVENCQELGQSPAWGRMASGVREAAWQFRVRPPRKGGKPLIGAWVQIRIDFLEGDRAEPRRR